MTKSPCTVPQLSTLLQSRKSRGTELIALERPPSLKIIRPTAVRPTVIPVRRRSAFPRDGRLHVDRGAVVQHIVFEIADPRELAFDKGLHAYVSTRFAYVNRIGRNRWRLT